MQWEIVLPVISIISAMMVTGTGMGWWLSGQFAENRKFTYTIVKEMKEEIFKKLEYHEKHDDTRFSQIENRFGRLRNDIWEIRLRNAAKDSQMREMNTDIKKLKDDENEENLERSES